MAGIPNYLAFDTETTGAINGSFGNPFTHDNGLCVLGYGTASRSASVDREEINSDIFRGHDVLVGFNLKFDIHWLRRVGIDIRSLGLPIWDCQLAHFICQRQRVPYPSLSDVGEFHGVEEEKFTDIKTEYWDKGIDNDQVPTPILKRRVEGDVRLTGQVFEAQLEYLKDKPQLKKLIFLACQDLLVLEEMEWNGMHYDVEKSIKLGDALLTEAEGIENALRRIVGVDDINWGSGDHISSVLYGGQIEVERRERYVYTYKSGSRKGTTTIKERKCSDVHVLPRRVDPLQRSELKKEGYFSTDDKTLTKLRPKDKETKELIAGIQRLREIYKKAGTYYHGLPKLYKEMGWTENKLHGSLNSCVAITGRLSSTKPNQQNMDHGIRECIVSRF